MALLGQCPRSEFVKCLRRRLWAPGRWTFMRVNWELGCQERASWSSYCCSGIWTQLLVTEGHSRGRIKALRSDRAIQESGAASWSGGVSSVFPPSLSQRWEQLERKLLSRLRASLLCILCLCLCLCLCTCLFSSSFGVFISSSFSCSLTD